MPVVWCRTSADSAIHQAGVEATDSDGLCGRLLTKGTELPVQLPEQGKIRSRNRGKHQEQTRGDQSDHGTAPSLKRSLSPHRLRVVFIPADHGHQCIDVQHQTSAPGSVLVTGLDCLHHNQAPTLNDQVIGGWHQSVAAPPHPVGKPRLAPPPIEGGPRQENMKKGSDSQTVVQITLVSAWRELPRAQHGSRHSRQSARD